MPIIGVPDSTYEILENFNIDQFDRTIRQKGIYYYIHKIYPSCRIRVDISKLTITFSRTLTSDRTRKESVVLDLKNNLVLKTFRQSGVWNTDLKEKIYPFSTEEDAYFQHLVLQDKYFPTFEDMIKLKSLSDFVLNDVETWTQELFERAEKRNDEASLRLHEYYKRRYIKR